MEHIYPTLEEHNQITELKYKEELERQTIINFKNDLDYLKKQIIHYEKLYKKWKNIDNALRYFSIAITGISSMGAIVVLSIRTVGVGSVLVLPMSLTLNYYNY